MSSQENGSSRLAKFRASLEMQNFLDQLSVIEIIETSLSGDEKLVAAIQEARIPMTSFKLNFDAKKPSIQFKNEDGLGATWNLYAQNPGTVSSEKFRIGRFMVPFTKTTDAIFADHHDVELSMDLVLNHLLKTFNCSNAIIEKVVVDLAVLEDPESTLSKLKSFRKIKSLEIVNSTEDGLTAFQANTRFWSQLRRILVMLPDVEHFSTNVADSPSEPLYELMTLDSVVLDGANWIAIEVVGVFSWKFAKLKNTKLTAVNISEILTLYLTCPYDRVEVVEIEVEEDAGKVAEVLMTELPADSFKIFERKPQSHHPAENPIYFRTWSHYMRITREDGKAAVNVYFDPNLVIIESSLRMVRLGRNKEEGDELVCLEIPLNQELTDSDRIKALKKKVEGQNSLDDVNFPIRKKQKLEEGMCTCDAEELKNKPNVTELDISELLIQYSKCNCDRMKFMEIEVEFDAIDGSELVMDALPPACFKIFERQPLRNGYDHPTRRVFFRACSHYIRISREDGNAVNVYFDPHLVIIEPSPPVMVENPRAPWKLNQD